MKTEEKFGIRKKQIYEEVLTAGKDEGRDDNTGEKMEEGEPIRFTARGTIVKARNFRPLDKYL